MSCFGLWNVSRRDNCHVQAKDLRTSTCFCYNPIFLLWWIKKAINSLWLRQSKSGLFPSFWIWAGSMTCLDQQKVVKVTMWALSSKSLKTLFLFFLGTKLPCKQAQARVLEDENPGGWRDPATTAAPAISVYPTPVTEATQQHPVLSQPTT